MAARARGGAVAFDGKGRGSAWREFEGGEVEVGRTFGKTEHLNVDHLAIFVVVKDNAVRGLFGLDDGGLVETEVGRRLLCRCGVSSGCDL